MSVERLQLPPAAEDLDQLAHLLIDSVDGGASVSFMAGLTHTEAREWWESTLATPPPRVIVLVSRDAEGIAGTVQVQPAWAPNQPHRGEVTKLLVHRRARRRGLGRALMRDVEEHARGAGFTLLTLDAVPGRAGYELYLSEGWTVAGTIPGFALDPDGTPCDTSYMYKRLVPGGA